MPTLGTDCHITLSHAEIDGGAPYGFVLDCEGRARPGGISIRKEVASDGSTRVWVYFDVLLAERLTNPDGTWHSAGRAEMYLRLLQYLGKTSGLVLESAVGSLVNLGAIGFTAEERHLPESSLVRCQVNNTGVYWPPVDAQVLSLSQWDGTQTWGESYWR
jgi:hypothetical protein